MKRAFAPPEGASECRTVKVGKKPVDKNLPSRQPESAAKIAKTRAENPHLLCVDYCGGSRFWGMGKQTKDDVHGWVYRCGGCYRRILPDSELVAELKRDAAQQAKQRVDDAEVDRHLWSVSAKPYNL